VEKFAETLDHEVVGAEAGVGVGGDEGEGGDDGELEAVGEVDDELGGGVRAGAFGVLNAEKDAVAIVAQERGVEDRGAAVVGLALADHDFGGLDDGDDLLALLETELVDGGAGDGGSDGLAVADIDDDLGHDRTEGEADDATGKLVAGGQFHDDLLQGNGLGRSYRERALGPLDTFETLP
jgi:hypothetical protein